MKKIFFLFFIIHAAYAAQSIQVHAQLPDNSPAAELLFVVDDSDTGRKTPASMSLRAGQNLQTFQVAGDHYQLIPVKLQGPNIQFTPCVPTQVINNHSLIVTITGTIAPNQLSCAYRETTTLPQLYTPIAKPSTPITATPAITSTQKTGYKDYLTNLSQNCKQGEFHSDAATQKVDYIILGIKDGACEVSIDTNTQQKPLLCRFTEENIALLASPTNITQAEQGQINSAMNILAENIMKKQCKSL